MTGRCPIATAPLDVRGTSTRRPGAPGAGARVLVALVLGALTIPGLATTTRADAAVVIADNGADPEAPDAPDSDPSDPDPTDSDPTDSDPTDADPTQPPFPDVDPNSVHADAITRLAALEVFTGDADGRFHPADIISRAQFATLLARTFGLEPAASNRFDDVLDTNVHASAINAIADAGISTGVTATTFAPNRAVTRAALASLLARAVDLPAATAAPFDDVDPDDVHAATIAAAAQAGITTGVTATTFEPARLVRRDQLATMLVRALDHLTDEQPPATDDGGDNGDGGESGGDDATGPTLDTDPGDEAQG